MRTRDVRVGPASAIVAESDIIPRRFRSRALELRSVHVPEGKRRAGHGNALMRKICANADSAGVLLFLRPDGIDEAETARLESWYRLHGFERVQGDPVILMARRPQTTRIDD